MANGEAGSGVGRNVMVRFKVERDEIFLTYGRSVLKGRLAETECSFHSIADLL